MIGKTYNIKVIIVKTVGTKIKEEEREERKKEYLGEKVIHESQHNVQMKRKVQGSLGRE